MKASYWISGRLSLNTGGSRTGVIIAVAGIALAVVVLEFTLAIVVGFKHEIERKLTGFDAQISVDPPVNTYNMAQDGFLVFDDALRGVVGDCLPETEMSLAVRQPGILKTDNDFEGVLFVGRDNGSSFEFEKGNIVEGQWPDFRTDSVGSPLIISRSIASALGVGVGDRIYSTFIVDGAVKMRRQPIVAIYESDFGDYDKSVVYTSLSFLQSVAGLDVNQGTALEIRGLGREGISEASSRLQTELLEKAASGQIDGYLPVSSIEQSGAMYFNWLALLDTNVVVIFVLMLAVAGFTLVSSLFIIVLERIGTIGILRALGAGRPMIRNIFVLLAMRIVGLGMIIGNVLGIGMLMVQKTWHIFPLNPEMYYLNTVPVEIQPIAFVVLNFGIIIVSWLILILPAHAASSVDPAGAVKYE